MWRRSRCENLSHVLHFGHTFEMPVSPVETSDRQANARASLEIREVPPRKVNTYRSRREGARVGTRVVTENWMLGATEKSVVEKKVVSHVRCC